MTFDTYKMCWQHTEKAFNYLRRSGCTSYYCKPVENACGNYRLLNYCFADVPAKKREHIARTYPSALITYIENSDVEAEESKKVSSFARFLASK